MKISLELIGSAINSFTYGLHCLICQLKQNVLQECVLSIHDDYINIMHILIGNSLSYLLKLNEVNKVMTQDYQIGNKLSQYKIENYVIIQTDLFHHIVFATKTKHEKDIIYEGFLFFIKEAKSFYGQLAEYNPFKAQIMMLFLGADEDGGNLLDIKEILAIFSDLKISSDRLQIEGSILEINKILYEHENIKKPHNFQNDQLTPLGFEYILKYYAQKTLVGKIFHLYCPMYRNKTRSHNKTIVDVVLSQDQPHMSSKELKIFSEKELHQILTEQQCTSIIQRIPTYDLEGKEKNQCNNLLSFNNMCSLLFSKKNTLLKVKEQSMGYPLTDYYIFTDFSTVDSKIKHNDKNQHFEMILKRGSRCLKISIEDNKKTKVPVVKVLGITHEIVLQNVLRTILTHGFLSNPYPIIVYLEINCDNQQTQACATAIVQAWQNHLYVLPQNYAELTDLPTPDQLKGKILIMFKSSDKSLHGNSKDPITESSMLKKLICLKMKKLDFERKNQSCWNFCSIKVNELIKYEQIEEENICNYAKKIMVLAQPTDNLPFDPEPMFRTGVQLFPTNHCVPSPHTYYLHSKFSEYNYGYLLKPQWMLASNLKTQYVKNFDYPRQNLMLQVLCGQNIVINHNKVYLKGNQAEEKANKVFISDNKDQGFYSQIQLQTKFSIYCPEMATICINVINNKQDFLASRCVSYVSMREGLRTVPLLNSQMQESRNSFLLVKCMKQILSKPSNVTNLYK